MRMIAIPLNEETIDLIAAIMHEGTVPPMEDQPWIFTKTLGDDHYEFLSEEAFYENFTDTGLSYDVKVVREI